jgi:thiosulfate/3-mercaptopyruvate sulfurtransferase
MSQVLIESSELLKHLDDPDWVVVDCRFELADAASGIEQYQESHIPGAFFADLNKDLAGKITPTSGRHPLPPIAEFRKLLQSWGIKPATQVVAYDSEGGAMAAGRLWWMIRGVGHEKVAILNGGFPKWLLEDLPLDSNPPKKTAPVDTIFDYQPDWFIQADLVDSIRNRPEWALVDSRAINRFFGDQEVIDTTGGHIPGAKHLPYAQVLNPDGTFKQPSELRNMYRTLFEGIDPGQSVFYCGSGVTSVIHLVALEYAGLPGARLYGGSWSEWIRDPKHEIAVK